MLSPYETEALPKRSGPERIFHGAARILGVFEESPSAWASRAVLARLSWCVELRVVASERLLLSSGYVVSLFEVGVQSV